MLFTSVPLLETALKAAGVPNNRIFIMPMATVEKTVPFETIEDLVAEGKQLPGLEPLRWHKGQGARQPAFLCYSSGTSGLPVCNQ